MAASRRRRAFAASVGFVAAVSSQATAQSGQPIYALAALTVPTERLPEGCRLEPVDPDATGARRFVMAPSLHENPWIGNSRPHSASIREVVEWPVGPTYGLPSGPARHAKLAEDVLESYRARYLAANGEKVEVWAVRFNDPTLTLASSLSALKPDPTRPRIVFGATAVLAYRAWDGFYPKAGNAGEECLRAITSHIASMK